MKKRHRNKAKKKKQLKKTHKKMGLTEVPAVDHQKKEPKTHWTMNWMSFSQGFKDFMIAIAILVVIVLGGLLLFQGLAPQALFEFFLQAISQ